jgi:phosphomevalonate kinase
MKAKAPGKIVISGAYAVLRGAPALVAAVDRYVEADTSRPATFVAPEVTLGLPLIGQPDASLPFYDASALRENGRKLGLGSSAGICVASLAAVLAEHRSASGVAWNDNSLVQELFPLALKAHREAQGGGSGIDVAAACFGGVLAAHLQEKEVSGERLRVKPTSLPPGLWIETWTSPVAASTADFVRTVFACEVTLPSEYLRAMKSQIAASESALVALEAGSLENFIAALQAQFTALSALGKLAELPIVLPVIAELSAHVPENACFLPSGAGGGDISIYVGAEASPETFRRQAEARGLSRVALQVGAPGLTLEKS